MQPLAGIGKLRVEPAVIDGGPKAPVSPLPPTERVSAIRQGVSVKNPKGEAIADWVRLMRWPAIASIKLRVDPVWFAAKVIDTLPFPLPLLADEIVAAAELE